MKVARIVNESVRETANWSMALVELSDGQQVRIFNPISVGDEVESYLKDGYTNWKIKKGGASGDVDKVINTIFDELRTLSKRVEVLEAELQQQYKIANEAKSRVDSSEKMPEGFLKTSFSLEDK